jgi:hypothetical protein
MRAVFELEWRTPLSKGTEEIPAKSEACVEAGMAPIEKVVYVRQNDLNDPMRGRVGSDLES